MYNKGEGPYVNWGKGGPIYGKQEVLSRDPFDGTWKGQVNLQERHDCGSNTN